MTGSGHWAIGPHSYFPGPTVRPPIACLKATPALSSVYKHRKIKQVMYTSIGTAGKPNVPQWLAKFISISSLICFAPCSGGAQYGTLQLCHQGWFGARCRFNSAPCDPVHGASGNGPSFNRERLDVEVSTTSEKRRRLESFPQCPCSTLSSPHGGCPPRQPRTPRLSSSARASAFHPRLAFGLAGLGCVRQATVGLPRESPTLRITADARSLA